MQTEWIDAAEALAFWALAILAYGYLVWIAAWWYYGGKIKKLKTERENTLLVLQRAYDRIAEIEGELAKALKRGPHGRFVSNGATE